jgi:tRNA threonylcarbamoyladenosine biosynthesis protein TsaB
VSLYLAIETATDVGSVALGEPGHTVSQVAFTDRRHAAALVPAVEEVLRLAGVGYGDLAGLVVGDGPGSFTGLRIGFATAKGILAVHEGLALRTAPSLLAAAWVARRFVAGPVAALYDALRGEVFGAVYDHQGDAVRTLVAPVRATPAALAERTPVRPHLAVGDGAVAHQAAVQAWTGRPPLGPPAGGPQAGALIELLAVEQATVPVDDPTAFEPAYGRQAAAQDKWERQHGRPLPHSGGDAG